MRSGQIVKEQLPVYAGTVHMSTVQPSILLWRKVGGKSAGTARRWQQEGTEVAEFVLPQMVRLIADVGSSVLNSPGNHESYESHEWETADSCYSFDSWWLQLESVARRMVKGYLSGGQA